jgi:hypothetical protein
VTPSATIAKLEAILARVRSRAAAPRQAAPPAPLPPPPDELLEEESDQPTLPPPPVALAPPREPSRPPVLELSVDIDAGMDDGPATEEAAQPEAPAVADALSSQERLVAVDPVRTEASVEAVEPEPMLAAPEHAPPPPEPGPEEEIEQPPASSRRPLAPQPEERLAEMAFGAAEPRPALHTPPPESGRLPAAPEVEFGDEDTGVHAAAPASAVLAAEATRADLSGADRVAAVQGGVRAFHPTTFAELLDASLSL